MPASRLATLLLALLFAAPASAEKLLTTYATLTTEAAAKVARAALAECQKQGYTVAVAVVDRSGVPLALLRDNLAGAHTPNTAIGKAWTAASFRTDTTDLATTTAAAQPSAGIRNLPNVVAVGGGLMIRAKGALIGAVGVSGAPGGSLDDGCGRAGIATVQDSLEFE